MKGIKFCFLCSLLVPALAFSLTYPSGTEWVPGRALVNFSASVGDLQTTTPDAGVLRLGEPAIDDVLSRFEVTAMYRIVPDQILDKLNPPPDARRLVALRFPEKYDVPEVCAAFSALGSVVYAEPDFICRGDITSPNDERWPQQSDKRQMSCDLAWDFGRGSRDLLAVAVDGGFFWSHPDAHDNIWVNPGEDLDGDRDPYWDSEFPGDPEDENGVDDDGNGYADDLIGWDFITGISGCATNEDCNTQDNNTKSLDDHGTHVLGAIGAVGNNSIGIAGCNWQITIMPSRSGYLSSSGQGLVVTSAAVACISWATAHGVDIINMSYGGGSFNQSTNNAIQSAWSNGALLCAASGNDGANSLQYPCAYDNVVCVGSVDGNDQVSSFSNYGSWVDCYAPGQGTWSLSVNNGYSNLQGTSMASPNAAGVFALVWSIVPGINNAQLRDLVLQNCENITDENPGYDPSVLGFGRIDAARPLAALYPYLEVESTSISGDGDGDGRLEAGETGELQLVVGNDLATEFTWFHALNVDVTVSSNDPNLALSGTTYFIGVLAPGETMTLSNPNARITYSGGSSSAYTTTLQVHFEFEDGVVFERTATLRLGRAPILVVDDDDGANHASFYSAALAANYYNYDDHSTTLDGALSYSAIQEYDHVIWACGNENTSTLTQSDRGALQSFLDAGNNLMFCSQGADEDTDLSGSAFYSDYLHATSGGANGGTQVTAVGGDPISDGANLVLIGGGCAGNGNVSPSALNAANGGVIFYNYQTNGLGGAVRYENATYKSVYFGFALEAACGAVGTVHHREIVRRVMDWFGATAEVSADPVALPAEYRVYPAYPNPFNPEVTVEFELARSSRIRATLHDVLGRQVQLIADQQLTAGAYHLRVDGANLSTGSYWLSVSVDGRPNVQRIVLLK